MGADAETQKQILGRLLGTHSRLLGAKVHPGVFKAFSWSRLFQHLRSQISSARQDPEGPERAQLVNRLFCKCKGLGLICGIHVRC